MLEERTQFGMRCYRRLLHIPYRGSVANEDALKLQIRGVMRLIQR